MKLHAFTLVATLVIFAPCEAVSDQYDDMLQSWGVLSKPPIERLRAAVTVGVIMSYTTGELCWEEERKQEAFDLYERYKTLIGRSVEDMGEQMERAAYKLQNQYCAHAKVYTTRTLDLIEWLQHQKNGSY